jgi:hypothetical protein
VTESDWLNCTDPTPMLEFLQGKASQRKLRLFACACARLLWDSLPNGILREVVEAGEQYADGLLSNEERKAFIHRLHAPFGQQPKPFAWFGVPAWAEGGMDAVSAFHAFTRAVAPDSVLAKVPNLRLEDPARLTVERQPDLLRDVFGNLPRGPVPFDPAWRNPDALTLAGHIYHERAFGRTAELAGLLEAAGCEDADILSHLRGPGPHVRGCWPLDILLKKE